MTPAPGPALVFIGLSFLLALALGYVLTPLAVRLAARLGAIDNPDAARRVHDRPIPRAGGVAVVTAFVVVGVGATAVNAATGIVPGRGTILPVEMAVLFGGAAIAAVLGFLDDRYQLRARWQLMGQVGLALLAVAAGMTIPFVNNPLGGTIDLQSLGGSVAVVVTVLWIVGMINSINFIDGLDGLSTGISLIAAVTLGVISLTIDLYQPEVALVCAVLAGSLAGFLRWNFFPARVFIGTTGVYAVGFALAVISVVGTAKVALALLVLGVPIIDTFWIIVRRLIERQSPFTPDRGHFHHRLLDLGLTHRGAVLVIYGLCILLAVMSLVLSGTGQAFAFVGIVLGGGLVLYLMTRRAREALDARAYEEPPVSRV
ncbi:MraY family glycosyltransferase [soil metagenome]